MQTELEVERSLVVFIHVEVKLLNFHNVLGLHSMLPLCLLTKIITGLRVV